jgi:hypothetical protein
MHVHCAVEAHARVGECEASHGLQHGQHGHPARAKALEWCDEQIQSRDTGEEGASECIGIDSEGGTAPYARASRNQK